MQLYDIKEKKLVFLDTIIVGDFTMIAEKMSKEELLSAGFKQVKTEVLKDKCNEYEVLGEVFDDSGDVVIRKVTKSSKPLSEVKDMKSKKLHQWALDQTHRCKIDLVGFGVIDGGYNYITNAEALLNNYDLLPVKLFRMYDYSFKEVTKEQLGLIKKAIEVAGIQIHHLKWEYERAIAEAPTAEDVIKIEFTDVIEVNLTPKETK